MEKLKKKVTIVLMAIMMTMVFFADAQAKADAVIAETKTQVQDMVKESEVMQQAYAQANEIVNSED